MIFALLILLGFVFVMDFLLVLAVFLVSRLMSKTNSQNKMLDEVKKKGEHTNETENEVEN